MSHSALLYRTPEDYLAALLPLLRQAATTPTTVVVPEPNLRLLREHCAADGVDAHITWRDAGDLARNPGRLVPMVLHPVLDERALVVAEVEWPGRTGVEHAACVRHEASVNYLLDGRSVRLLCPYSAELGADRVGAAYLTHAVVEGGAGGHGYSPERALALSNVEFDEPGGDVRELRVGAGETGSLGTARAVVDGIAAGAGLSAERRGDVALVVTELVTNSLEHGGGEAVLRVWVGGGELVCEVRDRGRLVDPLAGLRVAPVDQPNGRGLLLVHTMADLVRFRVGDTGTAIRAHFLV
ncbi:sensor histidine kinase [Actinokineospora bangkokensis]|uniref:Anti-sigma regulatory factor n=1 Tax=Actinokineospora bangkokensis TaxID=1193682 RepID=A0A1Q9LQL1_9PSEU|nr:sensor histidine kinase [Actinokineospora bangkokensis]OLR94315.1 hypothetical protein BJP25_11125 [Actinokineospora bangkokensis]